MGTFPRWDSSTKLITGTEFLSQLLFLLCVIEYMQYQFVPDFNRRNEFERTLIQSVVSFIKLHVH